MNKAFNIAFQTGVLGLSSIVVLLLLLSSVEQIRGPKQSEPFLIPFQVGVFLGALAWMIGTVFLWVEGWIFILEGWRTRSRFLSLLLVIALLFFSVFAAYGFHIFRKRIKSPAPAG